MLQLILAGVTLLLGIAYGANGLILGGTISLILALIGKQWKLLGLTALPILMGISLNLFIQEPANIDLRNYHQLAKFWQDKTSLSSTTDGFGVLITDAPPTLTMSVFKVRYGLIGFPMRCTAGLLTYEWKQRAAVYLLNSAKLKQLSLMLKGLGEEKESQRLAKQSEMHYTHVAEIESFGKLTP